MRRYKRQICINEKRERANERKKNERKQNELKNICTEIDETGIKKGKNMQNGRKITQRRKYANE